MRNATYCRNLLVGGIVTLTSLCLGACGGNPNAADVPDIVTSATVELASVDMEILQAQEILISQCARSKGFDVPADYYTVPPVAQSYIDVGGVFRSKEEAESVGYSMQTADLAEQSSERNAYENSLSESEREKYEKEVNGIEPPNCTADASTVLFDSAEDSGAVFNTFNDIVREQSSSALDDRDVQSAIMDEYVPCMKKAGYDVRGLRGGELAAKKFGRYRKWNEPPNAEEKAMAVQDYQCQADANLMQRINNALERNAGTWMVANEAMLLERHEKLQQARERANQVISGKLSYEVRD
ncbi:hypothetical protein [Bifidobacterium pseudolongum]|uniref:hypothetical protein n=1 Tax=Bifidobacterium pseudolongum TaxID=1694 RepID=UPI00101F44D5|nr:hypothetical protein [Bifidobacterium pseudolongum]